MIIDFTASFVTGGGIRSRIENLRPVYAEACGAYFDDILGRRGKAFADSACGFLLLDSLLQKHNIDRAELVISVDENGRPHTNRPDLDFSISHSEGCAMCAVALGDEANIGVDVQRERPYSLEKMTNLARAFMNAEELKAFSEPASAGKFIPILAIDRDMEDFNRKNKQFYTAWTRRESYAKRVGSDIFDNLKTANIAGEHFREGVISSCGERYYYSICVPEKALAILDEPEEDEIEDIEAVE